MEKPSDVIDRSREWETLARIHARDRAELVFVVGRRRVGKSYLLARFAEAAGGIYYQATRQSESEQRASLARRIGAHFGDEAVAAGASFGSWDNLFRYLTVKMGEQPLLLVIDEFPYLSEASVPLTSVLQHYWDTQWQGSRLRLVLSGSYITAMQQLEAHDQPLFGRRTAKLRIGPFTSRHVGAFVPSWSARDRLLLYGLVGNLPGNLSLVDPSRSLAENIAELALDPGGRLVDEAEHILDAFVPNAEVHYAILDAIANGDQTWSALTSRVGRRGGSITRPLKWLEDMEIVERVVPATDSDPARSKRALYRVTDPYIGFWHALVAPLKRAGTVGMTDPMRIWEDLVAPRLDGYMGHVFEQMCREWVAESRQPFPPVRLGSWWNARSQEEVDVVAVSSAGELFVAECKWGRVTQRHLQTLQRRAPLVAGELAPPSRIHLGLFSGRGEFEDGVRAAADAGEVTLFGPEDVLGG